MSDGQRARARRGQVPPDTRKERVVRWSARSGKQRELRERRHTVRHQRSSHNRGIRWEVGVNFDVVKDLILVSHKISNLLANWPSATETEIHNVKGELDQTLENVRIDAKFRKHGKPRFNGAVYDPRFDDARLNNQLHLIFECMRDGWWRTLKEIASITNAREVSVSAQLRHLRKPRFGSYIVKKRARGERRHGLFEYQLLGPDGSLIGKPTDPT